MTAEEVGATAELRAMAARAGEAASLLAATSRDQRDAALAEMARALRARTGAILEANERDLAKTGESTPAFRDRLTLDPARIEAIARGFEAVAALPDPLARPLGEWTRPNGLRIRRIAQPIGVIGMIYESRPNVGADAAALCLKSGNAVILRGGSESFASARAIQEAVASGLRAALLPEGAVQMAPSPDRAFVSVMLAGAGLIDLIVPRGGKGLVERVAREARMPVLAHAEGLCHTYVHEAADAEMARRVVANAKMRRTGVCGATETLLIDAAAAQRLLPAIVADLAALGCRFRADPRARAAVPDLPASEPGDFDTEWLDAVLSVAVVDGVEIGTRAYRRARQQPHGCDRHRGPRGRGTIPRRSFLGRCALERLDAVLRRGGVRLRRRDRHRDGAGACARAGRARAAHHLSLSRLRHRPGASMTNA